MLFHAIVVLLLVAADQVLKAWVAASIPVGAPGPEIAGLIGMTHLQNFGAAFSMMQNMRWLFLMLTPIALGVIIFALVRRKITHPMGVWSLTVLFAGALGNFIDRVRLGYVVDMFEFLFMRFAVFNLADVFLTTGGLVFCVYYIFFHDRHSGLDGVSGHG